MWSQEISDSTLLVWQVPAPLQDMTLSDLQDLATRQQQQINAQQQLLASKVKPEPPLSRVQQLHLLVTPVYSGRPVAPDEPRARCDGGETVGGVRPFALSQPVRASA